MDLLKKNSDVSSNQHMEEIVLKCSTVEVKGCVS